MKRIIPLTIVLLLAVAVIAGEKFQGAELTKNKVQNQVGVTALSDSAGNSYFNLTLRKLTDAAFMTEAGELLVILPRELSDDQRAYIVSQASTWQLQTRAFQKK